MELTKLLGLTFKEKKKLPLALAIYMWGHGSVVQSIVLIENHYI